MCVLVTLLQLHEKVKTESERLPAAWHGEARRGEARRGVVVLFETTPLD